ncbi:MAG: CRISPR-associated endonuclease Cas2 [Gammaproteobacteria bacterium]|nr:CRISPR-associated endonuclease Cas2 [Gammaproteobacteria bacterium]MBT4494301.1 CRISPR-associated endonuclease Cas2 [Gammaproteobacteria bacterium]
MTAYIISYDLSQPGQNYEKVLKAIKSYGNWARLGGSAYIVISQASAVDVRDHISRELDSNDKIFVGVVKAPAAWIGMSDEVSDWLKKNL